MMARRTTLYDMMELGWAWSRLMAETQTVMTLRLLGMAGVWPVAPGENNRMVSEKAPAFARAQLAMTRAAMRGARPDQIIAAGLKPLGRKTGSNSRRLLKGR
jgi:hypothetical protein